MCPISSQIGNILNDISTFKGHIDILNEELNSVRALLIEKDSIIKKLQYELQDLNNVREKEERLVISFNYTKVT